MSSSALSPMLLSKHTKIYSYRILAVNSSCPADAFCLDLRLAVRAAVITALAPLNYFADASLLPTSTSRPIQKQHPPRRSLLLPRSQWILPVYGTHIRFWYVSSDGQPDSAKANPIHELVDEFNRSNTWGITVELSLTRAMANFFSSGLSAGW